MLSKNYIHIQNNVLKDNRYMSDIDNQTNIKNVNNIMIGPVFGHLQDIATDLIPEDSNSYSDSENGDDNENGTQVKFKDIDRNQPIGLIQMVNKVKNQPITDYDLRKFKAIQNLVGLSIDNTSEQHSIVNVRLGLYESLKGLDDMVKESQIQQEA